LQRNYVLIPFDDDDSNGNNIKTRKEEKKYQDEVFDTVWDARRTLDQLRRIEDRTRSVSSLANVTTTRTSSAEGGAGVTAATKQPTTIITIK
jgi:hypothetical protein